jgi:hypothetical protein
MLIVNEGMHAGITLSSYDRGVRERETTLVGERKNEVKLNEFSFHFKLSTIKIFSLPPKHDDDDRWNSMMMTITFIFYSNKN